MRIKYNAPTRPCQSRRGLEKLGVMQMINLGFQFTGLLGDSTNRIPNSIQKTTALSHVVNLHIVVNLVPFAIGNNQMDVVVRRLKTAALLPKYPCVVPDMHGGQVRDANWLRWIGFVHGMFVGEYVSGCEATVGESASISGRPGPGTGRRGPLNLDFGQANVESIKAKENQNVGLFEIE